MEAHSPAVGFLPEALNKSPAGSNVMEAHSQYAETPSEEQKYLPLPVLRKFHASSADLRCIVGPVGCLSGDTEFLSLRGWVRLDEYNDEEVLQCMPPAVRPQACVAAMAADWVQPIRYIDEPCDSMWHFRNKHNVSMVVSDEHRVPLYDYQGRFIVKQAQELAGSVSRHSVPINFSRCSSTAVTVTDELIRLGVAVNADGHFYKTVNPSARCCFALRKERKKKRLRELLKSNGVEHDERVSSARPTETRFIFYSPYYGKHYGESTIDWWGLNSQQLGIVIDEMQHWDGMGRGEHPETRFSTTSKEDADFIQFAAHATGCKATIGVDKYEQQSWNDVYCVHIAKPESQKSTVGFRCDCIEVDRVPALNGRKYCFEVPSGFFLARHNGRIFITGNSGKTCCATWEICYYLPQHLKKTYGIIRTRWAVVRNTSVELRDTTQKTIFEWFSFGNYRVQAQEYILMYDGMEIEILFRACDRPEDVKKFKSLELTGYWIDESIEVKDEIKKMLKNRIGRFPRKCPVRYGIETTNPPDVEHSTYSDFKWITPVPGPVPSREPLPRHIGFWQPPNENEANLRVGYYSDLRDDYKNYPDWVERYIEGKPGITVQGKLVYNNFRKDFHVSARPLVWAKNPSGLFAGWDNTGNCPACIIAQMPMANQVQVLREYHTERMGIVDFAEFVIASRNRDFPNATYTEWGDPAGENKFSKQSGDLTSNAELMRELGIRLKSSEQNFDARVSAVEGQLGKIIGGEPGLLIDPSCVRLINGFLGAYAYKEVGTTGIYSTVPIKNRWSHCFPSETLIACGGNGGEILNSCKAACGSNSSGNGIIYVPICKIAVNDYVATPNGLRKVLKIWTNPAPDEGLYEAVYTDSHRNNKKLASTGNHKIYCKERGWTRMDALQEGDALEPLSHSLASAGDVHVQSVTNRPSLARQIVYNLTVEHDHVYYADGILVSNCHDALQYLCLKLIKGQSYADNFQTIRSKRRRRNTTFMAA